MPPETNLSETPGHDNPKEGEMAEEALLIQVGRRGALTLPKKLREKYNIRSGDILTLLDLGGTLVDKLADEIARELQEKGITLEGMLRSLQEERERYHEERYAAKV
jgi:AbrB family looped-hinge helix DNA binding protein